jgi:hypothetical protein
MKNNKFFDIMFNCNECINMINDVTKSGSFITKVVIKDKIVDTSDFIYYFVSPLKRSSRRRIRENIKQWRNFVFEFDEGTEEEQLSIIKESGIPYTALIHSGNKSVHCIVALEFGVTEAQYKYLAKATKRILGSDYSCISWGVSRVPREDQPLLELRSRVNNKHFIEWVNWNIQDLSNYSLEHQSSEDNVLSYIHKNECDIGNSHNMAVFAAIHLKDEGFDYVEVLDIITKCRVSTSTKSEYEASRDAEKIVKWVFGED